MSDTRGARNTPSGFLGWRMVALAFLAQNCAFGISYGSFGPMLASTEHAFGITRTMASTGVACFLLLFGSMSPLAGIFIQRTSIRATLLWGAIVSAAAYFGLGQAPDYKAALLCFALLGIGTALLGIIGPITLISRWFVTRRACAMGVVTLPIFLLSVPPIIAALLPTLGRAGTYSVLGVILLALVPLLFLIVEQPETVGQRAFGEQDKASAKAFSPILTTSEIISIPYFWLVSLAVGCLTGAGVAFTVHLVPLGMERHMSLAVSAGLLTTYATSGIAGNLLLSWLADSFGPLTALIVTAMGQAALCFGLLEFTGIGLFVIAGLLGMGAVPVVMLHSASFSAYFGPVDVSRAMGLSYVVKMPFLLGAAPAVAYVFDRSGGYALPFALVAGILLAAAVGIVLAKGLSVRADRANL